MGVMDLLILVKFKFEILYVFCDDCWIYIIKRLNIYYLCIFLFNVIVWKIKVNIGRFYM